MKHNMWQNLLSWAKRKSTGRTLVLLVAIKLFVMFGILRLFFFQPTLKGLDDDQKAETVGQELVEKK